MTDDFVRLVFKFIGWNTQVFITSKKYATFFVLKPQQKKFHFIKFEYLIVNKRNENKKLMRSSYTFPL